MTAAGTPIDTPEDLRRVMQAEFTVSPQQWEAIRAPLEPAVVIAGAGSGKTSLMAARVVYLVVTGQVTPEQVLGLTFTTKAASELLHRVRAALDAAGYGPRTLPEAREEPADHDEALEPVVSTYNAYAASLLAEHGLRIGHEPDTRVMADASRYQLAARVIDQHVGTISKLSDHPKTIIDYILKLDAVLSEHLTTPEELAAFDLAVRERFDEGLADAPKSMREKVTDALDRRHEAMGLVVEYRRLKARLGLMDFSDQIAWAARLARDNDIVGKAEREKYRVVLLDEYQDTSVGQALMLRRLFPDGHAVMAVGDPNQAIYGWRGASVSNILRFADDFPNRDGRPVERFALTINRRSDARILEVANALAAPLYAEFDQVQRLESGTHTPGVVDTIVHESYAAELAWLATEVRSAHDSGLTDWGEIGVLVRNNTHAADVFDTLTSADIPVEIVGLSGLLRLPEVSDVLATLTLINDLTANAELLTLLNGPRWAVGPRDLALLGARATELAGGRRRTEAVPLDQELARAVAGADPSEVVALNDALDDPGERPYSRAGRERFALLSAELRELRSHAGEPLLEVVRRIIDTCGIDTELASSSSQAARARRENLDLFVKAIAEFQAIDGAVNLPSLLAWLTAEEELGGGLDIATPSESDSVKLLTVHRAKGLEWDVVFLLGVCHDKFPIKKSRGLWPERLDLLPTPLRGDSRDLPGLISHDRAGLTRLKEDTSAHEATEELRLGYVAFTRARHRLLVSSYLWVEGRKGGLGPSPYQDTVREALAQWGIEPLEWLDRPTKEDVNPLLGQAPEHPWPVTERTAEAMRRLEAAELVTAALDEGVDSGEPEEPADLVDQALIAEWDEELGHLMTEAARARATDITVPRPSSLSATSLQRLRDNPAEFARDLVRPMPRQPSPAARFGTLFHAWVEQRFGQQPLLDPDELPGRGDVGIDDYDDLRTLIARFEAGAFADRVPLAVEAPFAMVLAGQVVRGMIDAAYRDPGPAGEEGYLLVDWKTNRTQNADPWQLAVYRVAWAELHGVPLERVRAGFYYVRSGDLIEPVELPDRAELEATLTTGPDE